MNFKNNSLNKGNKKLCRRAACKLSSAKFKRVSSFDFSSYNEVKPQHKSSLNIDFLEWFIGFTEGDGSFHFHSDRPVFVINQTDLEVLYRIRTTLGFGVVSTFTQKKKTYARYTVKDKKGINQLIALFNGNLHLKKAQNRFECWVKQCNKIWEWQILLKSRRNSNLISLKNSWLAGFFDAEGCCCAGFSEDKKMALCRRAACKLSSAKFNGFRLRLKASIDQQFEYPVLQQIASLLQSPNVIVRNKEKSYFRVEVTSKISLALVVNYLDEFKLQGRKKDAFAVWRKLVNLYCDDKHLLANSRSLKGKIQKVQEMNQIFKQNKDFIFKVQSSFIL
jgi:hypothetical protein